MTTSSIGPGTVLGGRYHLDDLLADLDGARFWRATDTVLARNVAVHAVPSNDPRADRLMDAARLSATVVNAHLLRVLDCETEDGITWVVNEWGDGVSLDLILERGPLPASRAAWLAREVSEAVAACHEQGVPHGHLNPESVLITEAGAVKLIGFVIQGVLHGEAPASPMYGDLDARERDVIDLAGILYAALVGRWPGVTPSAVPPAPVEARRPLRPRQVRAGVPRTLDTICERVLRREASQHVLPIETAYEIAAALADHVGDSSAVAPLDVPSLHSEPTVTLQRSELDQVDLERMGVASPAAPLAGLAADGASAASPADPEPASPPEAAERPAVVAPGQPAVPDLRDDTDADATAFHSPLEDSDGDLAAAGGRHAGFPEAPADPDATQAHPRLTQAVQESPPPPFEDLPERPLFASDTPRPGHRAEPAPEETALGAPEVTGESAVTQTGTGTGFWPFPEDRPAQPTPEEYRSTSPRNWWRLAALVAAVIAVLVAMAFAFNSGRGAAPSASDTPSASGGSTGTAPGQPVRIVAAHDFDPEASPPTENTAEVPLAVDGNPATGWQTSTYYGNPKLGGLKSGVGLLLDLGSDHQVSSVALTLGGTPTSVEVYAAPRGTSAPPTGIDGLKKVASRPGLGTSANLHLDGSPTTRYLVVWLTSLPQASGGYRGQINEIAVRS